MTTFPRVSEFDRARAGLDALALPYEAISPKPAYSLVGAGALVMEEKARMALAAAACDFCASGWVEHRGDCTGVPDEPPPEYAEDLFGCAAVMILASCSSDESRIRIVAHLSGDISKAFPYLNAEMKQATYKPAGAFTYMEGYRTIALYPRRIAVAKADDIVDAWRRLESVRRKVNDVWSRRGEIEPSYTTWRRPNALEIYGHLPQTNCGQCGLPTCLAFAMRLQAGHMSLQECRPVFGGERSDLREALLKAYAGKLATGD
ncbi:MAG: (Fe-S)-binding protein [Planctomycetota bacterium]